jgi:hypothetical protein
LTGEGEEKGTGILDVFDRYNFTVNEAEPLEKEVAVDPEMLGKVFENLLPENIRHASGTYYTPRVIVHYMCQQALLHYLAARAPHVPQNDLALFLRHAERFADFEAKDKKSYAERGLLLPESISQNAAPLDDFDQELGIEAEFKQASYVWRPKKLSSPTITLKPSFKRLRRDDYDRFLNEARLSALAMAIYFSGLRQSPAAGVRLLMLDDILIGLDMANRMTVLGIIEKLFCDWQVIILTYHKAWFEVLKARTKDGKWSHEWRNVTLRMRKSMGVEFPIVVSSSETLLAQARVHLEPVEATAPDIKAAAVYARTAFEAVMSWYCAEMRLPVVYVESRRELDTNDFLTGIENLLLTLRNPQDRQFAKAVIKEIKHARHFVLNPHSHHNPELEEEISAEIVNGIRAVDDFDLLLRCLEKTDFAEPGEMLEKVTVGELLFAALLHLYAGRKAAALDALARAFEQHLDEWFKLRCEMIPYGQKQTTTRLLARAGERKLFCKNTWLRLKRSRSYLLGDVNVKKLEPAAFEASAHLLLELRVQFLLGRRVAELTSP